MNTFTTICIILGATVISVAFGVVLLWWSDLDHNGYVPTRKRKNRRTDNA